MRSLTKLQDQVRVHVNQSTFIITDNSSDTKNKGLNMANNAYLRLSTVYKWPEFNRTDTSITTVSGTASYDWPSNPKFTNILNIEMQDELCNEELIPEVENELDWSHFKKKSLSFPSVYRLESVGSQKKITFAPTPSLSKTLTLRGIIEPDKFVNGDSQTIFDSEVIDDALEHMISASLLFKRGFTEKAGLNLKRASSLLKNYTGVEIQPDELNPEASIG